MPLPSWWTTACRKRTLLERAMPTGRGWARRAAARRMHSGRSRPSSNRPRVEHQKKEKSYTDACLHANLKRLNLRGQTGINSTSSARHSASWAYGGWPSGFVGTGSAERPAASRQQASNRSAWPLRVPWHDASARGLAQRVGTRARGKLVRGN